METPAPRPAVQATPLAPCPACGDPRPRRTLRTGRLEVYRCRRCTHRLAVHHAGGASATDYHAQYEAGGYVDSLRATRVRQAGRILERLRRHLPAPEQVLDFGAGRGWFLQTWRRAGVQELAGADTSALSVALLGEADIPAVQLPFPDGSSWPLPVAALPFRPRILTLLDVIEHFPGQHLPQLMRELLAQLDPELEWVVLKVPVASGLLYRASWLLSALGAEGPIEQLYQSGSFPPHESYFTRTSLQALLAQVGLVLVDAFGDRDFEPDSLADRAQPLRRLPRPAAQALGRGLARMASVLGMEDSVVFITRRSRGG